MTIIQHTIIKYSEKIKCNFLQVNYNYTPDDGRLGRNTLYSILFKWNNELWNMVFVLFQYMRVTMGCISWSLKENKVFYLHLWFIWETWGYKSSNDSESNEYRTGKCVEGNGWELISGTTSFYYTKPVKLKKKVTVGTTDNPAEIQSGQYLKASQKRYQIFHPAG